MAYESALRSHWIGKWMDPKVDFDVVAAIKATLLVYTYAKMVRNEAVLSLHVTLSQLANSIKIFLKRK
jgi:hypothetical protein